MGFLTKASRSDARSLTSVNFRRIVLVSYVDSNAAKKNLRAATDSHNDTEKRMLSYSFFFFRVGSLVLQPRRVAEQIINLN